MHHLSRQCPGQDRHTDRKFKLPYPSAEYTLLPTLVQHQFALDPTQPLPSGQRPLLFDLRRDLMRVTNRICTMSTKRNWQPTPLTAPSQRLIHTFPRSAACVISAAQDYRSQSFLAAGVDTPHPTALHNYQLRVSPACQRPRSQSRLKLKFQQPGAILRNHTRDCFNRNADLRRRRVQQQYCTCCYRSRRPVFPGSGTVPPRHGVSLIPNAIRSARDKNRKWHDPTFQTGWRFFSSVARRAAIVTWQ